MALWTGMGQAAMVAQLLGADIGGLISMIVQAALTARQNKMECEQLARRVLMIAELLPHVQDPEAARPLAGLGDTLRDAHELVVSCQGRNVVYQLVMAGRQAERFREVQSKIDSYLILFPMISHIGITRRLEQIYNVLVLDDSTSGELSPRPQSSSRLQESTEVAREVLLHGTEEFTFAELEAATNKFALDTMIGSGGSAKVHRGRLHDGREVAVKHIHNKQEFRTELDILSRLRHKHIIRLLGSCVNKDKESEGMIVYEYMKNGTLHNHLHYDGPYLALSPVRVSWKMRIDVLLGVSRAIEHMHCHANPPIIHHYIQSFNIIFDANWVPRVSDFGSSITFHMASEESALESPMMGTVGYIDPEYLFTGRLKPTSDVYNLGVVMLEVLTGKRAYSQEEDRKLRIGLACFALPIIETGNLGELLDRRPVPEPTPVQLQALDRVAQTAVCCVKLKGEDRPTISDIVADLEMAHGLICREELGFVHESVPSAGSKSLLESTEELRPHGTHEFTLLELKTATNNFAVDTVICEDRSAKLHRGRLHDGRDVAVKRFKNMQADCLQDFRTELDILSWLRHKHIIRLLGSCVSKDVRLLTRWRKEPPEEPAERLIVYEYMENGTLYHHLHSDDDSFVLSPVTVSWKMRIDVLLGVSRAIEHLHCHASTTIIHGDIKSLKILFDANWVPCVSYFETSITLEKGCVKFDMNRILGTFGYIDPQYIDTGCLKPASDVYNLGVVMLEVLTGKMAYCEEEGKLPIGLACLALPIIETGNLGVLLDKRPVPEPTPGQLQALEHVAQIAVHCLKLKGEDRPAISDIVANLEMARRLIRREEPVSGGESVPSAGSKSLLVSTEVAHEARQHRTHEFTFLELQVATNNFALDTVIARGGAAIVYWGRLHDGREVAVKRFQNLREGFNNFSTELDILSRLQHKHIIQVVGSCVSKDKRLLATPQKKRNDLLTRWRKELEEPEKVIVYEYMENGTLSEHLHSHQDSFTLSPVTMSWKMRIDVLLGVSRAIEHLYCHAKPPIIHRDIKSLNILLDASWVPCLIDFELSVALPMGCDEFDSDRIMGTYGYMDPQYFGTGRLNLASDVYSLGMVMLEVLTGKQAYFQDKGKSPIDFACFGVPIIEAGNLGELLDKRPVPEPTPWQLGVLEYLAQTAVCCVQLDGKDRPAISDIVTNLEMAHRLICREELLRS